MAPTNNPGIVDGEDTGENMGLGYNDANAPTDQGGDAITNGDDTIFGNGGDDTIDGAGGNDVIYGGNDIESSPITITVIESEAAFDNQLFAYIIDPDTGAISNVQLLSANVKDDIGTSFVYDAPPGAVVGIGIISPEGTFYSSGYGPNVGLNDDGLPHTSLIAQDPDGPVTLGFEDRFNLGDSDFDDVIVSIDLGTSGTSFDNAHVTYVSDPFIGDDGDDSIDGGTGDDTIFGQTGDDTLNGGDGDDVIDGGQGDDTIDGGGGRDTIQKGSGETIIVAVDDDGNGTVTEVGAGTTDTVTSVENFVAGEAAAEADAITLTDPIPLASIGTAITGLSDAAVGTFTPAGGGAPIAFGPGEAVVLSDILTGTDPVGAYTITDGDEGGQIGNISFENFETINFTVSSGPDPRDGIVDGEEFGELMTPGYNDANPPTDGGGDIIDGGPFGPQDTILGNGGDDTIDAGLGDDRVSGGTGDDEIDGGAGDDTILGGDGNDTVTDLDGSHVIDTSSALGTSALPDLGYPGLFPADTDPDDDRDSVTTGDGDDSITTGDDADTIVSGAGNDTINSGIDADIIDAGDGDDLITSGEGSDLVNAGDGADTIYGGLGPGFPDVLNITDDDTGGLSPDLVTNNGMDTILAGEGDDVVFGEDDDDEIFGEGGNDTLDGGIDEDTIDGGAGDDLMTGGQDNDVFVETAGDGADTVTDFGADDTGPITDGDQTNNDFVDLSGFYNATTLADVNAAGGSFANQLEMLRADAADGRIDGEIGGTDFSAQIGDVDLTLQDGSGGAVTGSALTFDNTNVPCFVSGTLIATRRGSVPVDDLRPGDEVITMDHGFQPIRWIGSTTVPADGRLAPVVIRRGAMGNERDLRVSPQHRMLVRGWHVELMFGRQEALVPAKALINDETVFQLEGGSVEYFHILFDRHELIYAEGIPSESFHPGHVGMGAFSEDAREEILALFPELRADITAYSEPVRPTLKVREARVLAENPELIRE